MESKNQELKQTTKVERFQEFEGDLALLEAIMEWWKGIESDEEYYAATLQGIWFMAEEDLTSMGAEVTWSHLTQQQWRECLEKIKEVSSNPKRMREIEAPEVSEN